MVDLSLRSVGPRTVGHTVWCSTLTQRTSSNGEVIETVMRGAVISTASLPRFDSQFNVSPLVATCRGAQMTCSCSGVSERTSTTSTAPLKTSPMGRRHLRSALSTFDQLTIRL